MRLFEDPRTPNSRRVRIFLNEKGLDIESIALDINALDHKQPEFAKMNPLMRVSVLELDDGSYLSESMAICRYLEECHPEPPLFGKTTQERAFVEMWGRRAELGLLTMVAHVFRHSHPAMVPLEVPQVPDWAAVNRGKISEQLQMFDDRLVGRTFLVGDGLTVADITLFIGVDFMRVTKRKLDEQTPNLLAWYEHLKGRETFNV